MIPDKTIVFAKSKAYHGGISVGLLLELVLELYENKTDRTKFQKRWQGVVNVGKKCTFAADKF